jgi:hypothetical protein
MNIAGRFIVFLRGGSKSLKAYQSPKKNNDRVAVIFASAGWQVSG